MTEARFKLRRRRYQEPRLQFSTMPNYIQRTDVPAIPQSPGFLGMIDELQQSVAEVRPSAWAEWVASGDSLVALDESVVMSTILQGASASDSETAMAIYEQAGVTRTTEHGIVQPNRWRWYRDDIGPRNTNERHRASLTRQTPPHLRQLHSAPPILSRDSAVDANLASDTDSLTTECIASSPSSSNDISILAAKSDLVQYVESLFDQ